MSTRLFPLPESKVPCVQCGSTEQWARLLDRPEHGAMKEHEKFTRRALADDSALSVEDGMVHVFVTEWHVLTLDGNEIPKKIENVNRVPQDILSLVVEEIGAITAATRPNDAIGQTVAVMRALKSRVEPEDAEKLDQAIALFREALGVPVPNAGDQTGS